MNAAQIFRRMISLTAAAALLFTMAADFSAETVHAAAGEVITHYKTGVDIRYKILQDGTVQLGDGENAALSAGTTGTLFIPEDVTSYDAWETVRSFGVSKIGAKAFAGCEKIDKVRIEGRITIDARALDGLPADTIFETGNTDTKKALLAYGIPIEQVFYKPARTKYVAFGDSIAAGYALPSYVKNDLTADKYPTPQDAFVSLIGKELSKNKGPAVTDNQAVSGWTSEQLLDQLNRGDYDAALKNADVITVTIGSNDLLGPFMEIVEQAVAAEFGQAKVKGANGGGALKRPIPVVNQFVQKLSNVINDLKLDLDDNPTLNAACLEFQDKIQLAILQKLHKAAPGAEIYWTTLYNPFYGEELDIKKLVPGLENTVDPNTWANLPSLDLGAYGARYIEKMNQAFKKNTAGYHSIDLYKPFNQDDLTNVEITRDDNSTPNIPGDDIINLNIDPHPNHEGHQLIADLALPVIERTYTPGMPAADLSHEKKIKNFSLDGVKGAIDEKKKTIRVTLPQSSDPKKLTADFTLSKGAELTAGGVKQISGVTVNDFTEPVTYTVTAEDGTTRDYTVAVTMAAAGADSAAVPTGDDFSIKLPLILLLVSILTMAFLVIRERRNQSR